MSRQSFKQSETISYNCLSLIHKQSTHKIMWNYEEFWFRTLSTNQVSLTILITVRCRYNAVKFLPNPYKRHSIAHPWGRDMQCLLWVSSLINVLTLSSQRCIIHVLWLNGPCYSGTWLYITKCLAAIQFLNIRLLRIVAHIPWYHNCHDVQNFSDQDVRIWLKTKQIFFTNWPELEAKKKFSETKLPRPTEAIQHQAGVSKMLTSSSIYKLLNFHFSINYKSFNVEARYFVCNFKRYLAIPHKLSCPYIERYDFYTLLKIYELSDLRAHMRFETPSSSGLIRVNKHTEHQADVDQSETRD